MLFEYVRRKRAEAAVDRACVATALADAAHLPAEPRLSLNVHASTLGRDTGFPSFLLDRASDARIDPHRLIVEIVEHSAAPRRAQLPRALTELRDAGVAIALDDVGLGQSNYKMILDVRPDIYKLDRYLVSGAWSDPYRAGHPRLARAHGAPPRGPRRGGGCRGPPGAGGGRGGRHRPRPGLPVRPPLSSADLLAAGYLTGRAPAAAAS